jgi:mannose-6-phosphate isomerase
MSAFGKAPIVLGPNQPVRPYRGGAGIARLRGGGGTQGTFVPEDFVASTTEVFAGGGVGLTRLPGGELLRDAIARDPVAALGTEHVARWGASTELLVKLLDTDERLFVHFHPDAPFARRHFGQPHGKTEAWIITEVRDDGRYESACAFLGFAEPVRPEVVDGWVADQDVRALVGALHRLPLDPGDVILVPAGVPHAIGRGVTLIELQEPSDLSILLERRDSPRISAEEAFLGLDRSTALLGLDRNGWSDADLASLRRRSPGPAATPTRMLPEAADAFFRAEQIDIADRVDLDASFSVLVVLAGGGHLTYGEDTHLTIQSGMTLLLPHGMGPATLSGPIRAVRCRPPAPSAHPGSGT